MMVFLLSPIYVDNGHDDDDDHLMGRITEDKFHSVDDKDDRDDKVWMIKMDILVTMTITAMMMIKNLIMPVI